MLFIMKRDKDTYTWRESISETGDGFNYTSEAIDKAAHHTGILGCDHSSETRNG